MVDASDEKQVSRAKQKSADRRRNRLRVLAELCNSVTGRQFLWDLISEGHVFSQTVDFGSHAAMCFAEGERSLALKLFTDIVGNYPQAYLRMTQENAVVNLEEEENGRQSTSE